MISQSARNDELLRHPPGSFRDHKGKIVRPRIEADPWWHMSQELSKLRATNEDRIDDCRPDEIEPEPEWAAECDIYYPPGGLEPASQKTAAEPEPASDTWRRTPTLKNAALHGPIGQYVRELAPHTEAPPAGILAATITTIGAMLGRDRYCLIEGAKHHARFYGLLVGNSATARKGTALHHGVTAVIAAVDAGFSQRTVSGLSSAEGLTTWVRDAAPEGEGPAGKGDAGVADKRLLVKQGELAGVLKVLEREGNTLSAKLREGWDGDDLQVMTRAAPLKATAPHICIIAAITPSELARSLKAVEVSNGFANRCMPFWCEREQFLPFGGSANIPSVVAALRNLKDAVAFAPKGEITWTANGRAWWAEHYPELSTPQAGGMLGTLLARGAPIVQRLALLFAVLDGKRERSRAHCEAAYAVWQYVEGSWRAIYATGDTLSERARKIIDALNAAGTSGLARSKFREVLGSGNISAEQLTTALGELHEAGLARPRRTKTDKGRPPETWVSTRHLSGAGTNGQDVQEVDENGESETIPTISTIPPAASTAVGPPDDDPGYWASIAADELTLEPLEDAA